MSRFTSIEQFRHVIRNVQHDAQFQGLDDDGNPIMDRMAELPTLKATGTVKLHGTNAGVTLDENGELEVWSRTRPITVERDNYGFAFFVKTNEDWFHSMLDPKSTRKEVIYGEWCGASIQKGVAISELEKMFVVFAIKKVNPFDSEDIQWYAPLWGFSQEATDARIFSIYEFPTYGIEIDFNNPGEAQNEMVALTEAVEAECPVAKHFGVSGIGEGVVWKLDGEKYNNSGYWWKVKGEKHSVSKVKKLAPIDVEKMASAQEFAETYTVEARLLQGIEHMRLEGAVLEAKSTGFFLKWLFSDIMKEEHDTLAAAGLEPKDVSKIVQTIGRKWYFKHLDTESGLG